MAKYAVVENGKVINTVVSEPEFAQEQGWISCDPLVSVGFDYINGEFVNNMPVVVVEQVQPSKEELLAQLQALQAQIGLLP